MKKEEKRRIESEGDNHIMTSVDTPMLPDAFNKSDEEKIEIIQEYFAGIMKTLGLNLSDNSLKGTPYRFAKMYVKELFAGLDPKNKPNLSVFDNKYQYNKMLVEKNITFSSACEHHFLPIVGKAHVGYISSGKVIGISKINRIVEYYGKRPQVQERMTLQIYNELKDALQTDSVIVVVDAEHLCVSSRGVKDKTSSTVTLEYGGEFNDLSLRNEFLKLVGNEKLKMKNVVS
ncbi:GTP cyclohydrolase I FolE [Flammeovirga yaeyamensis]|uniref:GTP cyclohydrolase 1 n=1 Tax=Flammeovirga yaeyamensis TaxID=367791 RepID=A0AAX1N2A1_9BACT|nr:GTP cyclohydrolase I FolE [Flammeovirga yaeyamensis]MBB3698193.1 GTP cyclohydrolase I [Flammeovirga yaeyamensis]NMF34452.1 GTP cyclohydrolase I FolE [Flammeovirga yaeyamensis]QWG01431.1 GTP cyclohydrolase I FolE [Flammeovirga yaeyamensis]